MAERDAQEVGSRIDVTQLVAEHGSALYRYAYRLTGSSADAEDLTQQTFLIVTRKLDQLRDPERALAWLMTVMRHCFIRIERRDRPARVRTVPLEMNEVPAEVSDRLEIDEEGLQAAIDELPGDYKMVLLSFYFEGRSYREIAEEFCLPLGTVMSRLARAKAHLRARLFERELQAAGPRPGAGRQETDRRGTDRRGTDRRGTAP